MECEMTGSSNIKKLFDESEYIYAIQSWESLDSKVITTHSFIINGVDTIPIFPTREEATNQLQGSDYLDNIVGVIPSLLARQIQGMEYAILNPGKPQSIVFKTCLVEGYAEGPST
jgi:hypothetical protein